MKLQIKRLSVSGKFVIGRVKTWIICFEYLDKITFINNKNRMKKYET